jgi:uncharacterized protein (DUF362 family)
MKRRTFVLGSAIAPAALAAIDPNVPKYRIVTPYHAERHERIPGTVVSVHSEKSIDEATEKADPNVVRDMMTRGMLSLTGETKLGDAWRRFIEPSDVVGIKVNCSGAPKVCSNPFVVAEIVRNLTAIGVKPANIQIYERFEDQLKSVGYGKYLDQQVPIDAVEVPRGSIRNYDPKTYVEVDFFGEDDTRSNMVRWVTERFTKIINVPNMKDHGAAGVTGCLKNMAYGNFSNVARSHKWEKTNTKTFIGTLASTEPLRSRVVLNVMDGLKGVWHGGPFVLNPKFVFYPKTIAFTTDPVSADRLLIDIIEKERKSKSANSVWDRSRDQLITAGRSVDPMKNHYIREPGHIEYAGSLGLGVYDINKIKNKAIEV